MKKLFIPVTSILLFCSCAIFQKKEKYGCPTGGAAVGAEKIASGDPKAMKAAGKSKYKGGKKF
jgi:hypothetical protein